MTSSRTRAVRVLAAGAALIGVAWVVSPVLSPPLYDGLAGPAEAYRYLNPRPGTASTPAPGSATKDAPASGGTIAAAFVTTDEQPPQVQVLIGDGALVVPAAATKVTISLKAVPPPLPIPAALGRLDGNVYQVSVTPDTGGAVSVKPGVTPPTVVLRGPTGSGGAQIARLETGGSWQGLHTVPLGATPDMVAASTTAFGYFTLVLPAASPTPGGGGGGGGGFPVVAVVVPAAVVVILTGVLVAVSLSRRRPAAPAPRRRR
jgi:hypothetical protein